MSLQFIHSLNDVFAQLHPFTHKRMFGGYGLFKQGLMFALVFDDEVYLKANKHTQEEFIKQGCEAFIYTRQKKPVSLQYYLAPETIFDDPDDASYWGQLAFNAALAGSKKNHQRI
jgi:DNA transformation protein